MLNIFEVNRHRFSSARQVLSPHAASVSKTFSGSNTRAASEVVKGFTKFVSGYNLREILYNVAHAHIRPATRRKTAVILKRKAKVESNANVRNAAEF